MRNIRRELLAIYTGKGPTIRYPDPAEIYLPRNADLVGSGKRLGAEAVVTVINEWLPRLAEHAIMIGDDAWLEYVDRYICRREEVLVDYVEHFTRLYVFDMVRLGADVDDGRHVPFDDDVFRYAAGQVGWWRLATAA